MKGEGSEKMWTLSRESARELVEEARKAMGRAYAPYSGFKVGASILTREGRVYTGCNIENASYGASICAERVALFKAISEGEKDFVALAVVSDGRPAGNPVATPCGICRQVIMEFAPDVDIIMSNPIVPPTSGETHEEYEEYEIKKAWELLPMAFALGEGICKR